MGNPPVFTVFLEQIPVSFVFLGGKSPIKAVREAHEQSSLCVFEAGCCHSIAQIRFA